MRYFIFTLTLLLFMGSCVRKDIDRSGHIRLRGEKPITLDGKSHGELVQRGIASWYGRKYHGRRTSNGEIYDMNAHTAAHKTLPFGTIVRVVHKSSGRQTRVRINDRGPFVRGRIIDLSRAAAQDLGLDSEGVGEVEIYLETESSPDRVKEAQEGMQPESSFARTKHSWTLQVGSFSEFRRARNLVTRFEDCAYKVRIEKFETMYRVRIGSFSTKEEAIVAQESLDLTGLDSWVLEDKAL